ncbi:MAG: flagellar hook-length control protein FliK, partial [Alphaproteobacteria bacterium]|nr:flagellar hook-length control protein FliK [Alphaproteobacteria bacterium]
GAEGVQATQATQAAAPAQPATPAAPVQQTQQAERPAQPQQTKEAQQAKPHTPQPPVSEQVSVQITKAAKTGNDHIVIQLRPDDMGRIEVKLDIGTDGRVGATIIADSRETLDAMQKDSRNLEKALNEAGLKTDSDSLNFSLRGEKGGEMARGDAQNQQQRTPRQRGVDMTMDNVPAPANDASALRTARGGVDIQV